MLDVEKHGLYLVNRVLDVKARFVAYQVNSRKAETFLLMTLRGMYGMVQMFVNHNRDNRVNL